MAVIIPPYNFERDPGAEDLLAKFRLLMDDIFSRDGQIYSDLGKTKAGLQYREHINNPIIAEYFAKAYENARLITDNCAAIKAAGGLPESSQLASPEDIEAFFRKVLTQTEINCHQGMMGLNDLSKDIKTNPEFKSELVEKIEGGFILSVAINRQLDPVLIPVIKETLSLRPI